MPDRNDSERLTIARIRKVWGRRGEVAAEILTESPERFQPGAELLLSGPGSPQPYRLENAWFHKGLINLKFQGFDSISAAEALVGREIVIPLSDRKPLDAGRVYLSDLIGCTVRENGESLGIVEAVQELGAAPLLQVGTANGELLIPFAEEICAKVDLENREIHVRLPEGLKELNASSGSSAGRGKR